MQPKTKKLNIKGKPVAFYEIEIDVLFMKMIDQGFPEESAIHLISELEGIKFRYVSYLNIEDRV